MRLPHHKYLGPGNTLDEGEPVDEDDRIARHHDRHYEQAETEDDIRAADREAIDQFWHQGSLHGYVGAAGLAAKYAVEGATGVLYPSMKHKGQQNYAEKQRWLAAQWREHGRRSGVPYAEWYRANAHRAWHPETADNPGGDNDERITAAGEPVPGPSRTNRRRNSDPDPGGSRPGGKQIRIDDPPSQIERYSDSGSEWDISSSGLDAALMDVDETVQAGPAGPSGSAGRTGPGRPGGRIIRIPRSIAPKQLSVRFSKSRILFSYAYAQTLVQDPTVQKVYTSLGLLPVDYVPFYLTRAEFDALPLGAIMKSVHVTVKPLGVRTAFEFGGTTSGHTTNEFVPVGVTAVGLNLKWPLRNVTYTSAADKPMVPTSETPVTKTGIINKLYEKLPDSCVMGIPRHVAGYAMLFVPAVRTNTGPPPELTIPNGSSLTLDEDIDRFLVHTAVGKPVVEYSYEPNDGLLKHILVPWVAPQLAKDFRTPPINLVGKLLPNGPAFSPEGGGHFEWRQEKTDPSTFYATNPSFFYEKSVENLDGRWLAGQKNNYIAQPQVHVGMQAVPAMSPTTDRVTFQNSSVYWEVTCSCEIQYGMGSAITRQQGWRRQNNRYGLHNTGFDSYYNGLTVGGHPLIGESVNKTDPDDGPGPDRDTLSAPGFRRPHPYNQRSSVQGRGGNGD